MYHEKIKNKARLWVVAGAQRLGVKQSRESRHASSRHASNRAARMMVVMQLLLEAINIDIQ
jgi:hypothetical protein